MGPFGRDLRNLSQLWRRNIRQFSTLTMTKVARTTAAPNACRACSTTRRMRVEFDDDVGAPSTAIAVI